VVTAVGVEQLQLAGTREQGLVLVLAVDFDQQAGQFGQLCERGRPAVDPGPRTAVGTQGAPQLAVDLSAVAGIEQFPLAKPVQGFGTIVQFEFSIEVGAFGAVPHHAAVGAQAGQETEGIDQ
jgi:hypothetical protein